jgi:DNA-directed RNA polymerase specialized sigma24 family protein
MIPEADLKVIKQVARRYQGLPGVEFEDLVQEGRIAWWLNHHKKDTRNWYGLLSVCVSRAIQQQVLGYSFQIPWYVAYLTRGISGNGEEQIQELADHIQKFRVTAVKLPGQVAKLAEKGVHITERQLAEYKAREMLRDSINIKRIEPLVEDGEDGS